MLLVEVEGTKGGRDVKHTIYCHFDHGESYSKYGVTGTSFLTGTGAAAGALQRMENEKAAGVYAPEQLDAARYFEILEGLGVKPVHIEE
jgi:saccharopine dehydrogenase-like NADP-dependent oxidoreductase